MCEIYGFCGSHPTRLNQFTDEFWLHSRVHQDGFGFYLADKDELYVNPRTAMSYIDKLNKKNFTSKLAMCHIRFKTHGIAKLENCHPFIKTDSHGVRWSLIHNGYISDNPVTAAMGTIQSGETDSERILLCIIESINSLYEHSWVSSNDELLQFMYIQLEVVLHELSSLGKTNLIFTDDKTNNMYVYMNSPRTLFYLKTEDGYHISTTPLTHDQWIPVEPYRLHVINNGKLINY